MRKELATPRARNWSLGKCVGLMPAGISDWPALRAARIIESKKTMDKELRRAMVLATPVKNRTMAPSRNMDRVERKINGLRSKDFETCKALVQTRGSTAQREDALMTFSGAVLCDMARSKFKISAVSNKHTVHEPALFWNWPCGCHPGC